MNSGPPPEEARAFQFMLKYAIHDMEGFSTGPLIIVPMSEGFRSFEVLNGEPENRSRNVFSLNAWRLKTSRGKGGDFCHLCQNIDR